jgi:hypothetical protein
MKIYGDATAESTTELTVAMSRFGIFDAGLSAFNFTVGGVTQADPDAYIVDLTEIPLPTASLTNVPYEITGYTTAIAASTPATNFTATTATNVSEADLWLLLRWSPTSATSLTITPTSITASLIDATKKVVDRGFQGTTTLTTDPIVEPATGTVTFGIYEGNTVTLTDIFSDFAADLQSRITAGAEVFALRAQGQYDIDTDTLTASTVVVILN